MTNYGLTDDLTEVLSNMSDRCFRVVIYEISLEVKYYEWNGPKILI